MAMSSEVRTRQFLSARGFTCEPEPDGLGEGRRPDFWCHGPCDLWVEVKSLLIPAEEDRVGRLLSYLSRRAKPSIGRGRAFAYIAPEATEKDAKQALALAEYGL